MLERFTLEPHLAWGLTIRGIGLVYLASYTSLFFEVLPWAGTHGISPAAELFRRIRKDFGWRRFWYFPSILWWLGQGDRTLRSLIAVGWLAAAAVVIGGPWSPWALLVCYVVYLSYDRVVALNFPWESLLFEMTVLGLFIPATHPLPDVLATAPPPPIVVWAFHLLLFRLMLGFGKQKFIGSSAEDSAYLKGYLVWQPLPSKPGWYMQHLPLWMLRCAVFYMFLVEVPAPFLLFFPGDPSTLAALMIASLMVGIALCGTYGYFSVVSIVLCLPMLDTATPLRLNLLSLTEHPIATAYVIVHTIGALLQFPANSWATQTWMYNPIFLRFPSWLFAPVHFYRGFHQFRLVHPYGVFPPKCAATARFVPVVEASWDGETWEECEYRLAPTNARSTPRFLVPHHARGDQAVTYEGLGAGPASLGHSTVGLGNPYDFVRDGSAQVIAQRILEGAVTIRHYFRPGTFPPERGAPRLVRMTNQMLEPVSLAEHRRTGAWWHRTYVGPHLPPTRLDPEFWKHRLPEPELWHWDDAIWRKRTRLSRMLAGARAGEAPASLVAFDGELSEDDVNRFWNEFLPFLGDMPPRDWSQVFEAVERVRARYGPDELRRFERVFARLHLILLSRLEPLYFGRGLHPPIEVTNYFQLAMLAQHILAQGPERYAQFYAHPESARGEVPHLGFESGLCLLGLFRHDAFVFEAQKLRLLTTTLWLPDLESEKPLQQKALKILKALSAYVFVIPFLVRHYVGPRFEVGFPERYPRFTRRRSGEVLRT